MRIKKSSEFEKEEAEQGEKEWGENEERGTGSYVKDFRKAKHDLGRQKLLADWERSFIHQRAKQDSR